MSEAVLTFMKVEDISEELELNLLIYGPPGCGKTRFALSTKTLKQLHISTEWKQARGTFQIAREEGRIHKDMQTVSVSSYADLLGVLEWLQSNPEVFDLVVLDNLSDIQDFIKKELIGRDDDRKLAVLNQGEWQDLIDKTSDLTVQFRDASKHFIAIAHYAELFSNETKYIRPSLAGKALPSKLSGYMNAMGYMYQDTLNPNIRRILFSTGEEYMTKAHTKLPALEEANLDLIIGKVLGKYSVDATIASIQEAAKARKLKNSINKEANK